jgi:hypothetical protein
MTAEDEAWEELDTALCGFFRVNGSCKGGDVIRASEGRRAVFSVADASFSSGGTCRRDVFSAGGTCSPQERQ